MGCEELLEGYFNFLKKNLLEVKEKEYCKLELPFPKPGGDVIQIGINETLNDMRLISDQGFIFDYLLSYGIDLWGLTSDSMKSVFARLMKRENLLVRFKPEIVIESSLNTLFSDIFRMSIILNELASLRLLVTPTSPDFFRKSVEMYFDDKKIKYISNPRIKLEIKKEPISFSLDFRFIANNTYAKVITSDSIIKNWAVNFDQIKRYSDEDLSLWAIYNDRDNITAKKIEIFLDDYADNIIAWSIDSYKFEKFYTG